MPPWLHCATASWRSRGRGSVRRPSAEFYSACGYRLKKVASRLGARHRARPDAPHHVSGDRPALDVDRLKFVDESGVTLAMIRRYGRATPGQRVVDPGPDNYGTNQTMIAALSLGGLDAPWVVDGAVNGDIFRCWVSAVLCPTLQPEDIVLWDNLSAHKVAGGKSC